MRPAVEAARFVARLAASCVFAAAFFAVLVGSHVAALPGLTRYDTIFVACVAIQVALVAARVETKDELAVLALFHGLGLGLELWKTDPRVGSWAYPEAATFAIGQVPLYSGFMYAAVASFICQAWRRCDVTLHAPPTPRVALALVAAIYLNFFTHHLVWDLRWPLTAAVVLAFRRTSVTFATAPGARRRLPMVAWFALVGLGIWAAENAATAGGAWAYPDQRLGWRAVSLGKIHAWALLVIVTFVLVAELKRRKAAQRAVADELDAPARAPTAAARTPAGWR
ncbi:MAG: DUF817 domain-containing protein [Myxococcales bacterium]|nr:DUF817 domain-containing protein [Myxococcales bacterium]